MGKNKIDKQKKSDKPKKNRAPKEEKYEGSRWASFFLLLVTVLASLFISFLNR